MSLYLLGAGLFWMTVVSPIVAERRRRNERIAHEEWRRVQAQLIKSYHPVFKSSQILQAAPYSRMSEVLNIDGTYDQIR